jgi:very-short-patch-repair endonuclease
VRARPCLSMPCAPYLTSSHIRCRSWAIVTSPPPGALGGTGALVWALCLSGKCTHGFSSGACWQAPGKPLPCGQSDKVGNTALSRGERVDRDGAFSSRRGTGEGLLPAPSELILPRSILPLHPPRPPPTQGLRELRCHPTDAQRSAWRRWRGRKLGVTFRCSCRLEYRVVDFCCLERRLAIELDEKDFLRTFGISWRWMPNRLVMNDREESVRSVRAAITCSRELTPHPSRSGW